MTPQSSAPVAGDEPARPASDQPVEAIGAGREDWLALVMLNVNRVYGDGLPPLRSLDETSLHYANEWREEARLALAGTSRFAALSPASSARTPMGGEVEALREALEATVAIRWEMVGTPTDSEAANAWALALDEIAVVAAQALAASSPSPAQGGTATWHPLDDNGMAEVRINGKRITTMPSYPGAEEVAQRINAALAASPQPAAVAWRWRFTAGAYGIEGATPGAWTYMERPPQFEPHEAWRREVQALGVIAAPPSVQPVEGK